MASLGAQTVKASAYNAGDPSSIPGLGRSPGEGNGNPLQPLAWKIPWTEEPGRLQPMGLQRVGHDWATSPLLKVNNNGKEKKLSGTLHPCNKEKGRDTGTC